MQDRSAPGRAMKECLRISGKCFVNGQELVIERAGVDEMEQCVTHAHAYAAASKDDARVLDAMHDQLVDARKLMRQPIRDVDERMGEIHDELKSCRLRPIEIGMCEADAKEGIYYAIAKATGRTQKLLHDCPMMFGWSVWTERIDLELPGSDEACTLRKRIIDIANSVRKCCKKVMYIHQQRWDNVFHGDVTVKLLKDQYDEMWADLTDAYTMLNEAVEIIDELDARIFS